MRETLNLSACADSSTNIKLNCIILVQKLQRQKLPSYKVTKVTIEPCYHVTMFPSSQVPNFHQLPKEVSLTVWEWQHHRSQWFWVQFRPI